MRLLSLLSLAILTGCPGPDDKGGTTDDTASPATDDTATTETDDTATVPTDDTGTAPSDRDGDGSVDDADCAPDDATIYPGATEVCDGIDQDCDTVADNGVMLTLYTDVDGDGYGDEAAPSACAAGEGQSEIGGDCKDDIAEVNPGAAEICNEVDDDCNGDIDGGTTGGPWYADADGDGYGDPAMTSDDCAAPRGYVADGSDCNDGDAAYNPAAVEEDCADPSDYNCDGSTGYADADADGFAACEDCNDSDAAVNAGAIEMCDDVDNNCDGLTDDDTSADIMSWYADADADGYGDPAVSAMSCVAGEGWIADWSDCNDADAAVNPMAVEICDEIDNNCDTWVDDDDLALDLTSTTTWYWDFDADGFGDPALMMSACSMPEGYVADWSDCNDANLLVNPAMSEVCDGVGTDDNCNGETNESGATGESAWYTDVDDDGYGDAAMMVWACDMPADAEANADDCNDADSAINPAATEMCDELNTDENCNGEGDEAGATGESMYYMDSDVDGYGDPDSSGMACDIAEGWVMDWSDCNDGDSAISPAAVEMCDELNTDENCDGSAEEAGATGESTYYMDTDGDGYGDAASSAMACDLSAGWVADMSDCDDTQAGTNPGATEMCDELNVDENCNGAADEAGATGESTYYADADADAYGDPNTFGMACDLAEGWVADMTDCDDSSSAINPGMTEMCDERDTDENCSGTAEEAGATGESTFWTDSDADGYGDSDAMVMACDLAEGDADIEGDCDDTNAAVYPDAIETCNDVDDDCDEEIDEEAGDMYYLDDDGDGFGDESAAPAYSCEGIAPAGYRIEGGDCDDTNVLYHPYSYDYPSDTLDHDCDGATTARVTWSAASTGDDASTTISPLSFTFPFGGSTYGTGGAGGNIYMVTNGRVTFGTSGDTDYSESLSDLTSDKAVMPYWEDLYTTVSLQGQYAEFDDAMTFAWIGANACCTASTTLNVTMFVTLFDDGRILMTYGPNTLTANGGLVGWAHTARSTPTSMDLSGLAYDIDGYWGYGTGLERSVAQLFSTASPDDLVGTALRFCGHGNGVDRSYCAE